MRKSYQSSDQKEKLLPSIGAVTVAELLEQLRQGFLHGCDTVRVKTKT